MIDTDIAVLAKNALMHTRFFILNASTSLEYNGLCEAEKRSVVNTVAYIRNRYRYFSPYSLETKTEVLRLESIVFNSIKHNAGNCFEMGMLALDYVMQVAPDTRAEIFSIQGGDHVFLVLGRELTSIDDNPQTWGNAYICDPLADKFYPAYKYRELLKNYYTDDNDVNCIEHFNPNKHALVPAGYDSKNFMADTAPENVLKILNIYTNISTKLININEQLIVDLKILADDLQNKSSTEDAKYKIIQNKVEFFENSKAQIYSELQNFTSFENKTYRDLRQRLELNLELYAQKITKALTFSRTEKYILYNFRPQSWLFVSDNSRAVIEIEKVLSKNLTAVQNVLSDRTEFECSEKNIKLA